MIEEGQKKKKSTFQLHLDVAYSACHSTNLICVVPLLWGRAEDLQFILVAIHSCCNSYCSKLIQSFCFPGGCQHLRCCWNVPKRNCLCPRQYESAGFWWQSSLILFAPLLCFLNEKPVYSTRHTNQIPRTKKTFLRVCFLILNYLNMIDESVHS